VFSAVTGRKIRYLWFGIAFVDWTWNKICGLDSDSENSGMMTMKSGDSDLEIHGKL
jgi:hypothetical protein